MNVSRLSLDVSAVSHGGATVQITRWRYGNDRLYVRRADGNDVGWWDLLTGEEHPVSANDRDALAEAVHDWMTESNFAGVSSGSATDRPWVDLALNEAGQSARAQAEAARQAAPARTLLGRLLGLRTEERAWRIGADGEVKIAAQFDKVVGKDSRWQFIQAIPVGTRGSDIDHLVVGPGGVFTVNAKNHPNAKVWVGGDTFLVNGHRQPYVRNSRHEAGRAGRMLSRACGFTVPVEGVIAIVSASEVKVKTPPQDVHVVPRRQIARWLLRHGDVLDDARRAAVFDAARRSTTWR
jgi:hypothetical protein